MKQYNLNLAKFKEEFEKYQAIDTSHFVNENDDEYTFHPSKTYRTFREIVNDEFYIRHNSDSVDAQLDFEKQLYEAYQLKVVKSNNVPHSLSQIIKKHSSHYETIREEVQQKKSKYYS
jgi:hypothetical protein